jgi:hypothetical protein
MLIYRPTLIPDLQRTSEIWRAEVQRAGFPDLFLCWVESWGEPPGGQGPKAFGLDATVGFMPTMRTELHPALETLRGHRVVDYKSAADAHMNRLHAAWKRFPSVMVGWDNTARRAKGATIFEGATPASYERWLKATADSVTHVRSEENYLFILAWNEWAEGNHLEPDQRYGRAFLEATRSVLLENRPEPVAISAVTPLETEPPQAIAWPDRSAADEVWANVADRVTDLELPAGRAVVDLADPVSSSQRAAPHHPRFAGTSVVPGLYTDTASLKATLDDIDDIGALLLVDVLQHLAEPHDLLSALSAWSLDHHSPPLLISVPHVAHVDMALQVLCGQFETQKSGPLNAANLRFFTADTLQRLVERSGWQVTARDDLHSIYSESYKGALRDGLPEELVGALQATAEAVNPNWSVTHFVWVLEPHAIDMAPSSFEEAITPTEDEKQGVIDPHAREAVADYMASVGLVASETNRRAAAAYHAQQPLAGPGPRPGQRSLPLAKRAVLKYVYSSPRRAAMFRRVYARLR